MTPLHYACPLCDWTQNAANEPDARRQWLTAIAVHRGWHPVREWEAEVNRLRQALAAAGETEP